MYLFGSQFNIKTQNMDLLENLQIPLVPQVRGIWSVRPHQLTDLLVQAKTLRSRLRFCRKVALVHRRSTARPKGWPCSIHLYIYTHIIKAIIYRYLTFIIIHYYKPHGFSKLQVFGWMNLMIFHLKAILRGQKSYDFIIMDPEELIPKP